MGAPGLPSVITIATSVPLAECVARLQAATESHVRIEEARHWGSYRGLAGHATASDVCLIVERYYSSRVRDRNSFKTALIGGFSREVDQTVLSGTFDFFYPAYRMFWLFRGFGIVILAMALIAGLGSFVGGLPAPSVVLVAAVGIGLLIVAEVLDGYTTRRGVGDGTHLRAFLTALLAPDVPPDFAGSVRGAGDAQRSGPTRT